MSQKVLQMVLYFSNSFQKLTGNEYCSKVVKEFRFQVIYTSNMLLYRVSPGYLNLKLKQLSAQIQNSSLFRIRNILRTLQIYPVKIQHIKITDTSWHIENLWDIQNIVNLQNTFYTELTTLCNPVQRTLEVQSEPCQISIMERLFRALCNPGIFGTLPHSEPKKYSEFAQVSMMQHFVKNLVCPWHIQNPGILRT